MGILKVFSEKVNHEKGSSDSMENPLLREDSASTTTVKIEASTPAESPVIHRSRRNAVSVALVLVVTLATASFVLLLYKRRQVISPLPEFCCSCEHMGVTPSEAAYEADNRKSRCCASTENEYVAMMKAMINKQHDQMTNEKVQAEKRIHGLMTKNVTITLLHQSPVAAHVLISTHNSEFQNPNQYNEMKDPPPVRNLLSNRSTSLLRGVGLERDRLIIKTEGLYLIYSQMYFKVIQGTNWHKGVTFLSHIVDRYNDRLPNGGEQKLLQDIHTLPQRSRLNDPAIDFHTSYISGVFKLNAHDEIYARVTNQDFLSRDPIMSFIGLVKIG